MINWKEMADMQRAFLSPAFRISTCLRSCLHVSYRHWANKHNIKYILNGGNISTECVRNLRVDLLWYRFCLNAILKILVLIQ